MASFFASGRAVDLVLVVLAVELVWLVAQGGPGPARRWAPALAVLPGACLLLALRAALVGASWPWIALPLTLSFPVHLADLRRRRP